MRQSAQPASSGALWIILRRTISAIKHIFLKCPCSILGIAGISPTK
jgi:hypothetical protein